MGVQTSFSIKDLENLSQIKAHTIRIWEKRYKLLDPTRSETNIRSYSNSDLQKLLNVSLLLKYGYKISNISIKTDDEIKAIINENVVKDVEYNSHYNAFKLSMLNFDKQLFEKSFTALSKIETFENIFLKVFFRLFNEIGLMWQTKSISPTQEHFISTLIYQKLLLEIDKADDFKSSSNTNYILFLPEKEIHQIGILFIQYKLLKLRRNTIFLGPSISTPHLVDLQNKFDNIEFITNITVKPDTIDFFTNFEKTVLTNNKNKLHVFGYKVSSLQKNLQTKKILLYNSPLEFFKVLTKEE